jgi:uncharacterized protein YqfA (UPF0365 family)
MDYLTAFLSTKVSETPLKFSELRLIRKNKLEIEPYVTSIITLKKAGVIYDRDQLLEYYISKGQIENIAYGLVKAKIKGVSLFLSDAIKMDSEGVDLIKLYK